MSDPIDDKLLEDYLHRKSALSMGYRRVYIEAPPPELDRTVTARARRALRWLVPGVLSTVIAVGLVVGVNYGVTNYMDMMVKAEKNVERLKAEAEARRQREPVSVIVDPNDMRREGAPLSRVEWEAKIEKLRREGKQSEALEELAKYKSTYPDTPNK